MPTIVVTPSRRGARVEAVGSQYAHHCIFPVIKSMWSQCVPAAQSVVAYGQAFVLSCREIRPKVGILNMPPVYLNNAQQVIKLHPDWVKDGN